MTIINIIKNNTFVWLILVASDSTEVQTLASIGIYSLRVSGSIVCCILLAKGSCVAFHSTVLCQCVHSQ